MLDAPVTMTQSGKARSTARVSLAYEDEKPLPLIVNREQDEIIREDSELFVSTTPRWGILQRARKHSSQHCKRDTGWNARILPRPTASWKLALSGGVALRLLDPIQIKT